MDYTTPKWERIFDALLSDIRYGKCVLLLGPEIIKKGDTPLNQCLNTYLREGYEEDIAHFYEKDGFFLFKKGGKSEVRRGVRRFYEKQKLGQEISTDIFKAIAEMSFPLVISFNPDVYLPQFFTQNGIKHNFAYFEFEGGEGKPIMQVEKPTKSVPLVYNLCGYVEKDASMILDYNDLFKYMKAILGKTELPSDLRTILREETSTFICLGFDFEKWYSQVILHLLSEKEDSAIAKKYAINKDISDPNTKTFLVNQFEVIFLGDENTFFFELHRQVAAAEESRKLGIKEQLNRHIENAELAQALEMLDNLLPEEYRNDFILTSARFNRIQNERDGMYRGDYSTEFSQVTKAILELANLVEL